MENYTDFFDTPVYLSPDSTVGELYNDRFIDGATIGVLLKKNESAHIGFLSKIIKAIGFDIERDCNVRLFEDSDTIDLKEIVKNDKVKYIFAFGLEIDSFDVQAILKRYNWNRFENFSLLHSYSLTNLQQNQKYKMILWSQLQKQFNEKGK